MEKKLLILVFLVAKMGLSQSLYFPPINTNVWDTANISNFNWCQNRVDSLTDFLQLKNTKGFIVLKNGKIVVEKYFGTFTKDSTHIWNSAGKSFSAVLTGIAQKQGLLNINNTVSSYLGSSWSAMTLGQEQVVTLKQLISMSSGMDDNPSGTGCSNLSFNDSCLQYLTTPNTRWAYHTGAYKKIMDVISSTSGLSFNAFTNLNVNSKIGMQGFWISSGVYFSKLRSMARFGLLNLNKGIWQSDTILNDSIYFNQMINTSQSFNISYGYLWWLNGKASYMVPGLQITYPIPLIPNAPSDLYCALGKDDQKIYIVPSQQLVVCRFGNAADNSVNAISSFDNDLWQRINELSCNTNYLKSKLLYENVMVDYNASQGLWSIKSPYEVNEVEIYSISGNKTIQTKKTVFQQNVIPGLYIVHIKTDFGVVIKKVSIQ